MGRETRKAGGCEASGQLMYSQIIHKVFTIYFQNRQESYPGMGHIGAECARVSLVWFNFLFFISAFSSKFWTEIHVCWGPVPHPLAQLPVFEPEPHLPKLKSWKERKKEKERERERLANLESWPRSTKILEDPTPFTTKILILHPWPPSIKILDLMRVQRDSLKLANQAVVKQPLSGRLRFSAAANCASWNRPRCDRIPADQLHMNLYTLHHASVHAWNMTMVLKVFKRSWCFNLVFLCVCVSLSLFSVSLSVTLCLQHHEYEVCTHMHMTFALRTRASLVEGRALRSLDFTKLFLPCSCFKGQKQRHFFLHEFSPMCTGITQFVRFPFL